MRRIVVIVAAVAAALSIAGPAVAAQSAKVAALQVALRANGLYKGEVDGISGPMTRSALVRFQRRHGIRATGKVGYLTRCKLGALGRPLLGQRELVAAGSAGTSRRSSSACGASGCPPRSSTVGSTRRRPPR